MLWTEIVNKDRVTSQMLVSHLGIVLLVLLFLMLSYSSIQVRSNSVDQGMRPSAQ